MSATVSILKPTDMSLPPAPVFGSQDGPRTKTTESGKEAMPEPPTVDLSVLNIRQLMRSQRYQRRKTHVAQENLTRLQTAAARTVRLACAARSAHRTFAECIRLEDKSNFANLLYAFHDASDACFFPADPAELDLQDMPLAGPGISFLDGLSSSSRGVVLDLLSKLRYDGAFIADRLSSLTQSEATALLSHRSNPRFTETSIFGGMSKLSPRASSALGPLVDSQMELLASQSFGSPLEMLIYLPRSITKVDPGEDDLSTDIWAQVCARMITDRSPVCEKILSAVFDVFARMCPWPGKERLEVWILQTLQQGAFLLEAPPPRTFRARMEGEKDGGDEYDARKEAFYSTAAQSLLELLADPSGASVLPPGALQICRATSSNLQATPELQNDYSHAVLLKWLTSDFLMDAIVAPEVRRITKHVIRHY
jgi:hypothetical protein